jgi:hypothetical protein
MTLKIGVYLTDDVARRFRVILRRSGMTKSGLVNEALTRFFHPPPTRDPGEEVLRALGALGKRVRRLHRETEVITETLALFVRYFLIVTPPLQESERPAGEALGRERYQVFIRQIAQRLVSDKGLISDVMQTIVATRPDLAARAMAEAEAENASGLLPFGDAHASQPCEPCEGASHA